MIQASQFVCMHSELITSIVKNDAGNSKEDYLDLQIVTSLLAWLRAHNLVRCLIFVTNIVNIILLLLLFCLLLCHVFFALLHRAMFYYLYECLSHSGRRRGCN